MQSNGVYICVTETKKTLNRTQRRDTIAVSDEGRGKIAVNEVGRDTAAVNEEGRDGTAVNEQGIVTQLPSTNKDS